jgi:hypothetical protein
MGNSLTIDSNTKLDKYASDVILQLSELDLKKLNDVEECNKLIIRISELIEKTTPQTELKSVLQKHIKNKSDNVSVDIAKFYVKTAHVYACIVKSINPMRDGDKEMYDITSLCGSRLFSLINGKSEQSMDGIPELDMLYNDSKYDAHTGKFNGRSTQMDAVYKKNLETFYMAFTGSFKMDYSIKKFSDIKIDAYSKEEYPYPLCETGDCSDESLFEHYAVNIANNLKHINKSQKMLIATLHKLFTKQTIHPSLTDVELVSIIETTRHTIIDMYLTCEQHYEKGIAIYEAISNKKILKTLLNQQNELVKHRIKLMVGSK